MRMWLFDLRWLLLLFHDATLYGHVCIRRAFYLSFENLKSIPADADHIEGYSGTGERSYTSSFVLF